MKCLIFTVIFSLFIFTSAYSTCYVEGNYTAMITEEGWFTGKITSYTLEAVVKGDDVRELPRQWPNKYVRQYRSDYGEEMCKIGNKTGLEFIGVEQKTGERKYIVPNEVTFKCRCD